MSLEGDNIDYKQTDTAQAPASAALAASAPTHDDKHKRTTGMRVFDTMLYPILSNTGVFALSVFFTYLTSHGREKISLDGVEKLKYGKFGNWMAARGEWLDQKFMGMGMKPESAEMTRVVFFSFADGTLLAPLVKLFEDRRNGISKKIDQALGTEPADKSVYDEEPKQTWGSVIGGRAITAGIVVPTAMALEKTNPFALKSNETTDPITKRTTKTPILTDGKAEFESDGLIARNLRKLVNKMFYKDKPIETANAAFDTKFLGDKTLNDANINDIVFNRVGKGYGEKIEAALQNPETLKASSTTTKLAAKTAEVLDNVSRRELNKPSLFKIITFEAFYTSVCTAGLYLTSRGLARVFENRQEKKQPQASAHHESTPHIIPVKEEVKARSEDAAGQITSPAPTVGGSLDRQPDTRQAETPQTRIASKDMTHALPNPAALGVDVSQQQQMQAH